MDLWVCVPAAGEVEGQAWCGGRRRRSRRYEFKAHEVAPQGMVLQFEKLKGALSREDLEQLRAALAVAGRP